MAGTLYVVGTPIGNLEDLTLRATRLLGEVGLVAAEDTRQTRKLLSHIGASPRLVSYNEHNAASRTPRLLRALLKEDIALVTDAGMPAISDPGAELVRLAAEQGNAVVPIPGPSAVTTALAVSGFQADSFRFLGFPPRARKARRALLTDVQHERATLVLYEAPHRVRATLEDIAAVLGERPIAVCRELTKLHEEILRGTAADALAELENPRGEFAIVIQGAPEAAKAEVDAASVRDALAALKEQGLTQRDAAAQVMEAYGVSRREAYRLWLAV